MVIQADTWGLCSRRGDGGRILGIINLWLQSGRRAVRKIRAVSADRAGADLQVETCGEEGALRTWRSGETWGACRN